MTDTIWTIDEAAEYLRAHKITVYRWAREGKIPAFKIGSRWRFKKEQIERWIEKSLTDNQGDEMREIKFRAWSNELKRMFEVTEMVVGPTVTAWVKDKDYSRLLVHGENGMFMQFTGLHDKNGKEIWEGDIVQPSEMHDSNSWAYHIENGKAYPIPRQIEWKGHHGFNVPIDNQ